ncbi:MAG: hypothetical protein KDA42_11810, partial [Planctomycetales bacterium]|nr:hypothetical protein [Planctomycetales bacterium]
EDFLGQSNDTPSAAERPDSINRNLYDGSRYVVLGTLQDDTDTFAIDLAEDTGQTVDVLLVGRDGSHMADGALHVWDADGTTLLATGRPDPLTQGENATNVDLAILGLDILQGGRIYVSVASAQAVNYSLVVLANARFEVEPNDEQNGSLLELSPQVTALGYASSAEHDLYRLPLLKGDRVHISTSIPASISHAEPDGELDPMLSVLRADGVLLASDDNSLDGVNAALTFTADATGEFLIELSAAAGMGDYLLRVETTSDTGPDLIASQFDVTTDWLMEATIEFDFDVRNQGDSDAGRFSVAIVSSMDDTVGNADDIQIGSYLFDGLAAGEELSESRTLAIDPAILYDRALAAAAPGFGAGYESSFSQYLALVVDPLNAVIESNEVNNFGRARGLDFDDFTYFPFDVDGDSEVTTSDLDMVFAFLGRTAPPADIRADVNRDGVVTPSDLAAVRNRLGYVVNRAAVEPLSLRQIHSSDVDADFLRVGPIERPPEWDSLEENETAPGIRVEASDE